MHCGRSSIRKLTNCFPPLLQHESQTRCRPTECVSRGEVQSGCVRPSCAPPTSTQPPAPPVAPPMPQQLYRPLCEPHRQRAGERSDAGAPAAVGSARRNAAGAGAPRGAGARHRAGRPHFRGAPCKGGGCWGCRQQYVPWSRGAASAAQPADAQRLGAAFACWHAPACSIAPCCRRPPFPAHNSSRTRPTAGTTRSWG